MATLYFCRDIDNSQGLRAQHRAAHFTYIESIMDEVLIAGPVRPDDPATVTGSVFVYATDDPDQAQALLQADPYVQAGIYAACDSMPFLPAAGVWLGGGIWQEGTLGTDGSPSRSPEPS
ncbi:MAG: YciI family protein [Pseudomonadota bacterium]